MKLLFPLFLLVSTVDALSLWNPSASSNAGSLSQKAVLRDNIGMTATSMMTTRREPIRMPTQTPMVPFKVNTNLGVMDRTVRNFSEDETSPLCMPRQRT